MSKSLSKFDIFTTDLHIILLIFVATDVYALLLKILPKNHNIMFKTRMGGGVKGFLNNVKKKLHFSCMKASLKSMRGNGDTPPSFDQKDALAQF